MDVERIAIPTNLATGIDVDAIAAHLKAGVRPAFIYLIPDGHNPLGSSMSLEKRKQLIALAQEYEVPILEDDTYGLLHYEKPLPALRALNSQWVYY
jgi:2-aminoadipate transaminase